MERLLLECEGAFKEADIANKVHCFRYGRGTFLTKCAASDMVWEQLKRGSWLFIAISEEQLKGGSSALSQKHRGFQLTFEQVLCNALS
jgi:hypothetical protein